MNVVHTDKIYILSLLAGIKLQKMTSAKHEGYILDGLKWAAQGVQTLFSIREESVNFIKTSKDLISLPCSLSVYGPLQSKINFQTSLVTSQFHGRVFSRVRGRVHLSPSLCLQFPQFHGPIFLSRGID